MAQGRGWEHNTHGDLFRAVRLLAAEPGKAELTRLFGMANTLHVNFYENWLRAKDRESSIWMTQPALWR